MQQGPIPCSSCHQKLPQEAFVTAFQKLDGFRGDASFKTWVTSIAWHKALDRHARLPQWLRRLAPAGPAGSEDDATPAVERQAAPGQATKTSSWARNSLDACAEG
jgi:DNA-directed RNA polymerase specialized sigma24 family protein